MGIVTLCLSGLALLLGVVIMSLSPERTWEIKKFFDNYAPSAMPESWGSVNRSLGVGLIALGLLLIFATSFLL